MTLHVHLAGVVATGAAAAAAAAYSAARKFGPRSLPALALAQAAAVGIVVSMAATEALAKSTTGLMGKVGSDVTQASAELRRAGR